MSGEKYNRRHFIKIGSVLFFAPFLYNCNGSKKHSIQINTAGANSNVGHLLRTNQFPEPNEHLKVGTLIVGGGVSGLSAARWLNKQNENNFLMLEMDEQVGGNSKGGKNKVSEYPYGAHYLPIPNTDNSDLIDFLEEHRIITHYNNEGLPHYDPYNVCFAPHERLHYKGTWHDDLPPKEGISELDKKELKRFSEAMQSYRIKIGKDNKRAFAIPLENSSSDEEFAALDNMSMNDYLKMNGYQSEFIYWYLDYCCKDDFGTPIKNTSAWAAIHYFASRNGNAANASAYELLTWPEGNYFLIKKLREALIPHIKTGQLVYHIEEKNNVVYCKTYEVKTQKSVVYECQNLILATPQYVNKKLLPNTSEVNWNEFKYYPWLVANITIINKQSLDGEAVVSWDNVIYQSKSLGYVNACHQTIEQHTSKTVLTYYYNFSENSPKHERETMYKRDEKYWKDFIIEDLKIAHPEIEANIESIELQQWGHGMISPSVGFRHSASRNLLEKGKGRIQFAHSDISGISIFEQAFYRGIVAAKRTLQVNT